jgi:hypothetical protein
MSKRLWPGIHEVSLVSQGDHRIGLCSPSHWDVAGQESHYGQQERDACQGGYIERRDAIEVELWAIKRDFRSLSRG